MGGLNMEVGSLGDGLVPLCVFTSRVFADSSTRVS